MRNCLQVLLSCLLILTFFACKQVEKPLNENEKEQIKAEVIASIDKHIDDIISQKYSETMQFYTKEDYIVFGDGAYWGDYATIDDIWGTWLPRWRAIIKWDLKNHKVHVFSRDAAIDYVEWVHERIEEDGDTTKAYGFWVWGMQRFPEGWKSVNVAVDHIYTAGSLVKDSD